LIIDDLLIKLAKNDQKMMTDSIEY
jgi:hypothetical protein